MSASASAPVPPPPPTAPPARRHVSRTSVIVIVVLLVALVAVVLVIVIGCTMTRVRKNAHPANMSLVDIDTQRTRKHIPPPRAVSKLPPAIVRVVVSNNPAVDVLEGFLSEAEAAHLIAIAEGRFQSSTVVPDKTSGPAVAHPQRTSSSVFLDAAEDKVVAAIEARAGAVAGVGPEFLERLQVVRYQPGQFYKEHHDYLPEGSADVLTRGQRTLTIFAYLNTLPPEETGGGTHFPYIKQTIRPVCGKAVLFHDMLPNGQVDPRTLHGGEPLHVATKYGLNIWFRSLPQR